jgi:hypothetical protein
LPILESLVSDIPAGDGKISNLFYSARAPPISPKFSHPSIPTYPPISHFLGTYQGQWLRGMRHGYGVRTSAAFGIASHSRGADGRRPSVSSLQPGMEEAKAIILSNGTKNGGGGGEEARGGFVLKSRSDEAPVRRRSLVERTGMKNLMQVRNIVC